MTDAASSAAELRRKRRGVLWPCSPVSDRSVSGLRFVLLSHVDQISHGMESAPTRVVSVRVQCVLAAKQPPPPTGVVSARERDTLFFSSFPLLHAPYRAPICQPFRSFSLDLHVTGAGSCRFVHNHSCAAPECPNPLSRNTRLSAR